MIAFISAAILQLFYMNVRNHSPTVILRTLWEKPVQKRCEPVPAYDLSCTHPYPHYAHHCLCDSVLRQQIPRCARNDSKRGRGGYNFDISCISSDWQHWYMNTDNHFVLSFQIVSLLI